jgi:hypothetical protein
LYVIFIPTALPEVGRAENKEETIHAALITAMQGFPNSFGPWKTYCVDFSSLAPEN